MAIRRESPKCPKCGVVIDAIYLDQSDLPEIQRVIGDTFLKWDWENHKCEGEFSYETVNEPVCDSCKPVEGMFLGMTCEKCHRPFRMINQKSISMKENMKEYWVKFYSSAVFGQMVDKKEHHQEVEMLCQEEWDKGDREIIFNLPTPDDYKEDMAQFSIGKEQAELLISVFKFHFNLK